MITKICLIDFRDFDFVDGRGEKVEGRMYSGFSPDGPVEFSAPSGTELPLVKVLKFDPAKASDVPLKVRIFGNKVKFQYNPDEPAEEGS